MQVFIVQEIGRSCFSLRGECVVITVRPFGRGFADNKSVKNELFCDFSHLITVDMCCGLDFRGGRVADGDSCQYGSFPVGGFLIGEIVVDVSDNVEVGLNDVHGLREGLKVEDE